MRCCCCFRIAGLYHRFLSREVAFDCMSLSIGSGEQFRSKYIWIVSSLKCIFFLCTGNRRWNRTHVKSSRLLWNVRLSQQQSGKGSHARLLRSVRLLKIWMILFLTGICFDGAWINLILRSFLNLLFSWSYPLYLSGTKDVRFVIPPDSEKKAIFRYKVTLPPYLTCSQCVLQWTYYTGDRFEQQNEPTAFHFVDG